MLVGAGNQMGVKWREAAPHLVGKSQATETEEV
jgi:hypothetical protein